MGRRKFEPGKNGESKVVSLVSPTNGVCANKLFYANRLKEFRAIAHVTQADLASRLGLSVSAIANWESGRTRPDVSNIPALCNVLGISIAEFFSNSLNAEEDERKLLFRYRQLNKPHQMVLLNMAEQLLNAEEQAISSECPELEELLLADDQVAAGANYYDFSACCKPCYVHSSPVVRRADYVFKVNGDSMEPNYPDGCYVLVKKDTTALRYGDVGIFQADGSLYIKEYRKDGLHSINPAYDVMRKDHYGFIKSIGRVIGILDLDDFATESEIACFKQRN